MAACPRSLPDEAGERMSCQMRVDAGRGLAAGPHRFNRVAFSAAHVVADPVRGARSVARTVDRLGGDAAFAGVCSISASASPRRWTPRSAAWGSTGSGALE